MESEAEKVQRAYLALRRLTAHEPQEGTGEWVPAWSSLLLERVIEEILSPPGGRVGDVFHALWDLAGRDDVPLTKTMANFIHDIVVLCFTRYRRKYDAEDFEWMAEELRRRGGAPSQAYLALLALPERLAVESQDAILTGLKGTEFLDEARKTF